MPRDTPHKRYPIDGQCVAQAIETLSRAVQLEPDLGRALVSFQLC